MMLDADGGALWGAHLSSPLCVIDIRSGAISRADVLT